MKTKTTHRHLHPVHWHGSMALAIVTLLVTATKTSGDIARFLEAKPQHHDQLSSLVLRDAETIHSTAGLGGLSRLASTSGS